jgi:hypothetical protein
MEGDHRKRATKRASRNSERPTTDSERRTRDSGKTQRGEDVRAGKGRKDEVGRSGIYPATAPDAPSDAEVITPGELGHKRRE